MISLYVRRIHMYLALFLAPWMLAFALSNVAINHGMHLGTTKYRIVKEETYTQTFAPAADNRVVAEQVLKDLGMLGNYWIDGRRSNSERLTIVRDSPLNAARITYSRSEQLIVVEKWEKTVGGLMESVHRGGFGSKFMPKHIWGVFVDGLAIGMVFWVLSGIYMWWELRPTRKWGFLSLAVGTILFVVLVSFL